MKQGDNRRPVNAEAIGPGDGDRSQQLSLPATQPQPSLMLVFSAHSDSCYSIRCQDFVGVERRQSKGHLKSSVQKCFPCASCWGRETNQSKVELQTEAASSNRNDPELVPATGTELEEPSSTMGRKTNQSKVELQTEAASSNRNDPEPEPEPEPATGTELEEPSSTMYVKKDKLEVPFAGASESYRSAHEMANKRPNVNEASAVTSHQRQFSGQGLEKISDDLIRDAQRQAELEKKPPLMVPEEVVGVKALVAEILGTHIRDHKFVGIWGMGGVGKTTLAKVVFNKMFAKFEYTCFIEGMKQIPRTNEEAKSLVWKEMNHYGVPVSGASGPSERSGWYQVKGKSLLVVLDDVEDSNYVTLLEEIAYENGMEESRFVLTSRNAQRLRNVKTIRLDALEPGDAKKLFTLYSQPDPPESFREVLGEIVDRCGGLPLTLEVLGKYLKGREIELWEEIPGALRECDEGIADLEEKVWAKLQLSYDGLPGSEVKNMFLDIVTVFLRGNSLFAPTFSATDAKMAWSSTDKRALNRLQILKDRALVTVHGEEEVTFYMHEHLRCMGQRIARRERRHLNLVQDLWWSNPLDGKATVQEDQKLGKIVTSLDVTIDEEVLRICEQTCAFCIMQEVWPKLKAIRYMELRVDASDCCEGCKIRGVALPSTLVLLSLRARSDLAFSEAVGGYHGYKRRGTILLTRCFSLVKVHLDLSECGIVDFGGLGKFRSLRVLRIEEGKVVRNWPTSLIELRNLERLELNGASPLAVAVGRFSGVPLCDLPVTLPISLGDLTNLQTLILLGCAVHSVPNSLRELTSLRFLELDRIQDISTIAAIPYIIGSLRQLQVLRLSWDDGILEIPDTWGNLTRLQELVLYGDIKSLPASFSNLTRLEHVRLRGKFCSFVACEISTKRNPVRISDDGAGAAVLDALQGYMTKQKHLCLRCKYGTSAVVVRNMVNLESLTIIVRDQQAVPDIFGDLQKLQSFTLVCHAVGNSLVESLGRLSSLEELNLACGTLAQLPVLFGCSSTLRTLWIACPSLQGLPDTFGEFSHLTTLHINDNGLLLLPDSFTRLSQLKKLQIVGCDYLSHLPESLQCFDQDGRDMDGCDYFIRLAHQAIALAASVSIAWLGSIIPIGSRNQRELLLQLLPLQRPCQLQRLTRLPEALGDLHSLLKLELFKCATESLPESLGRLSSLTHLGVTYCQNVKTLPETTGDLSSLESLDLRGSAIHSLPGTFSNLLQLKSLDITDCKNLELPSDMGGIIIIGRKESEDDQGEAENSDGVRKERECDYGDKEKESNDEKRRVSDDDEETESSDDEEETDSSDDEEETESSDDEETESSDDEEETQNTVCEEEQKESSDDAP
ncbi:hypothetical protein R1sor_004824 [Riccia sorocarpa]|uniref:NB-ARC domain-containing protein n=1 Tax=Riccia sorocarpa TaxID=122646 RepID=A0ABD3HHR1_9MARC